MYKHLETLRLVVIASALIAIGIGAFKYMNVNPSLPFQRAAYFTANTQAEQKDAQSAQPTQATTDDVAIQARKLNGQKPSSSAPAAHGTRTPPTQGSTSCTPAYSKCSGTGKSSCCIGYGCCQGTCRDMGLFGTCPT